MKSETNRRIHAYALDNELSEAQKLDLTILLSLDTHEKRQEWADAVGADDVDYGISLLEIAALKELELDTEHDPCIDAKVQLSMIMSK